MGRPDGASSRWFDKCKFNVAVFYFNSQRSKISEIYTVTTLCILEKQNLQCMIDWEIFTDYYPHLPVKKNIIYISKIQLVVYSGHRNISFTRYRKKCFTQIYRDLYRDAMLELTRMSSNMANGNQQTHLLPSFATETCIYSSRNS